MADKLMMGRRTFVQGGLAASALAALAGCGKKGGSSDGAGEAKGGTMKFYINDPVAIDPYNTQSTSCSTPLPTSIGTSRRSSPRLLSPGMLTTTPPSTPSTL